MKPCRELGTFLAFAAGQGVEEDAWTAMHSGRRIYHMKAQRTATARLQIRVCMPAAAAAAAAAKSDDQCVLAMHNVTNVG